jgi:hypothetical protein
MNLNELTAKWEEHDRLLAKSLRLNRELLTAAKLKPAESALRRVVTYSGLEAAAWFAIVIALGNFIVSHIHVPGLALSGAAADLMSIGMLIALIRRMIGGSRIDYSQPVSSIQKQVEALRMLRIRTTQWGVLFGTLLWVPWLAVAVQMVFGVDIYESASAAWLLANVLFGLALFPAAIWVSKRFGDRIGRSPHVQRFMRDLAGANLNEARDFLAAIREFEQE